MMNQWLLLFPALFVMAMGDYECLCNYKTELPVYAHDTLKGPTVGTMYEFDCKPTVPGSEHDNGAKEIQYEHQSGFVVTDSDIQVLVCSGNPSVDDLLTTAAHTSHIHTSPATTTTVTTPTTTTIATTTPPTTTSTTTTPTTTPTTSTTTPTTTSTTTTPTTTVLTTTTTVKLTTTMAPPASTTKPIPEGHLNLCPHHMLYDARQHHGFIGQFGSYCYELVDTRDTWGNAERHCRLTSINGHLLHILSAAEQDYVTRFLSSHHYVKEVWTGLNDEDHEGRLEWTSGRPVSYMHMGQSFLSNTHHSHDDCFLFEQGGFWRDTSCGQTLVLGLGFGEMHPYICQYPVTSHPPNLFQSLPDILIG